MNNNDKPVKSPHLDDNKVEDLVTIERQQHACEVKRRHEDARRRGVGAEYEPEQDKCW